MNLNGLHIKRAIRRCDHRGCNPHLPIVQLRWTDETEWKDYANVVLEGFVTMEDVLAEIKRDWVACRSQHHLPYDARFRVVYPEMYPEALETPFSNSVKLDCGHPIQAHGRVNEDNQSEEPHCLWCGDITDMAMLVDHLSVIYCYASGGHCSKPMTLPEVVISLSNEREQREIDAAVKAALSAEGDGDGR